MLRKIEIQAMIRILKETQKYVVLSKPVTVFQMNQYAILCKKTKVGAFIDCGDHDVNDWVKCLQEDFDGTTIHNILQTHAHLDHIAGLRPTQDFFRQKQSSVPVYMHQEDEFWFAKNASWHPLWTAVRWVTGNYNFRVPHPVDVYLKHNDVVAVGDLSFIVLHTPGHTPGHVVFYEPTEKLAFVGDMIFEGSIGRTDLPKSNHNHMIQSLLLMYQIMDGATTLYPGHMGPTTMERERLTNPFIRPLLSPNSKL
eukprot:PhF_6_TR22697/c1_g1_i1/m.32322